MKDRLIGLFVWAMLFSMCVKAAAAAGADNSVDASMLWILGGVAVVLVALFLVGKAHMDLLGLKRRLEAIATERDALAREVGELKDRLTDAAHRVLTGRTMRVDVAGSGGMAGGGSGGGTVTLGETPKLAANYIDRDDFMKAIGVDYPFPVMLDDKLVHNGTGDPVRYYTDPNGQITGTAPPKVQQ